MSAEAAATRVKGLQTTNPVATMASAVMKHVLTTPPSAQQLTPARGRMMVLSAVIRRCAAAENASTALPVLNGLSVSGKPDGLSRLLKCGFIGVNAV